MRRGEIGIDIERVRLSGTLELPDAASGLVVFAHGSGSSRHSPRNRAVAAMLQRTGFGTLLFDLLTPQEEAEDRYTGHLRFDVALLAERLAAASEWAMKHADFAGLPVGYFGASTGAAAAVIAAAWLEDRIAAVVSRGGRPDLAGNMLEHVTSPTLLVVGERDEHVLELNREASARMHCTRELVVIPQATHLFEEPGALSKVADVAGDWYRRYLLPEAPRASDERTDRRPAA